MTEYAIQTWGLRRRFGSVKSVDNLILKGLPGSYLTRWIDEATTIRMQSEPGRQPRLFIDCIFRATRVCGGGS